MHSQTKYVELNYHFIHDRVAAKTLKVSFGSSKYQLVDILTKIFSTVQFNLMRSSLTLLLVPLNLMGAVRNNKIENEA